MTDDLQLDLSTLDLPSEQAERTTPCARLVGPAGSGKSYTLNARVVADPKYGLLTATTGISAMNLGGGCVTLNSTLGYFDLASMRDAFLTGQLARKLHTIAREYRWLVVEEYSMLEDLALDLLRKACDEANRYRDVALADGHPPRRRPRPSSRRSRDAGASAPTAGRSSRPPPSDSQRSGARTADPSSTP